jgi:hypothetical protein
MVPYSACILGVRLRYWHHGEHGLKVRSEDKCIQYQSKTICENKNVSYEAHLCPIIVKAQRAPNAQATLQIIDRHYEELKSIHPDSQTLKKAF